VSLLGIDLKDGFKYEEGRLEDRILVVERVVIKWRGKKKGFFSRMSSN